MPNKTYELRKLYLEQSQYSAKQIEPEYPPLLQWPAKGYFEKIKLDAELLQKKLSPIEKTTNYSIADQVFGNQKESEYLGLKHLANLFYERCNLHKRHIKEIDSSHMKIQEELFGVRISSTLRALATLCFGDMDKLVNSNNNKSIDHILDKNVILELDTLTQSDKTFFIQSALLYLHHIRMISGGESPDYRAETYSTSDTRISSDVRIVIKVDESIVAQRLIGDNSS
ncbi:MAG: hypothetical protein JXB29_11670 [Sedimentisphaerales bacterium]|nr:hypothetical protein [Sedimentisphaerales bacterium]